ncbi:2Fe-2S iron-sulfur cluster-binding protein [Streptomyces sp. NPDC002669]|uniref:(2Fe-2S)-binding protein n=1 Tax=Streptomyces sp. NPDC002669 TaxID=3364658 RepID=UPI00368E5445
MSNEDHNDQHGQHDRHDQHGQQESLQYGGWQPTPQGGEYDDGATAFVHLPPEDLANVPLAAPGQGFVPPMILPLTPAAGFDPASTDNWVARTPDGQEPAAAPEQQAPEAVHWPDPNQQQSPYGYGYPQFQETQRIPRITETGPAPYAEQDHLTGQAGQAGQTGLPHGQYPEPVATGQWNFTESTEYGIPTGHVEHGGHGEQGGHGGHVEHGGHTEQFGHTEHGGQYDHTGHTGHAEQMGHTGHTDQFGHVEHDNRPGHGGHDGQSGHGGPSGHTGQWTIPVAEGDLPEESGEFAASALAAQWYGDRTPPATLPGGAPAPWATQQPVPEPAPGPGAEPVAGPAPEAGVEPEHAPSAEFAPTSTAMPPAAPAESVVPVATPPTEPVTSSITYEDALRASGTAPFPEAAQEAPAAEEAPAPGAEPAGMDPVRETPSDAAPAPAAAPEGHPAEAGPGDEPSEAVSEAVPEAPHAPEPAPPVDEAEPTPQARTPEVTEATDAPEPEAEPDPEPGPGAAEAVEPAETAESAEPATDEATGTAEPEPTDPTEPADATDSTAPAGLVEPPPLGVPDERPAISYVLSVNGTDRPVTDAWIGESLLYVLRERLGLAGAKDGCSQGECGACNVQVDGRLVASCLVPAATTAGSEVRTVEGLAVDGEPSDVQRALAKCGAVQCGFCIPGMAMTVHDLLEGNHAPSELETRKALCGNLCRCSGYRGVLDAVNEVIAGREAAADPATPDSPFPEADENRVPPQAAPGTEEVWDPHAGSPHPGPVPDVPQGAPGDARPHSQDGGMA